MAISRQLDEALKNIRAAAVHDVNRDYRAQPPPVGKPDAPEHGAFLFWYWNPATGHLATEVNDPGIYGDAKSPGQREFRISQWIAKGYEMLAPRRAGVPVSRPLIDLVDEQQAVKRAKYADDVPTRKPRVAVNG